MPEGHRFPYREEGSPPILRPTVDTRIEYGATGDWTCRALVDTGSPITFFDRGVADALGLRIRYAGARLDQIRVLGGHWQVQFEHVGLSLPGTDLSWETEIAFVLDQALQMPFQGVLGTRGFLDCYAVTFNKYYEYFVIEHPDVCDDRHA